MYPDDFLSRIKTQLKDSDSFESFIQAIDEEPFKALRINTLKTSVEDFVSLNPFGIRTEDKVPWCSQGFYFDAQYAPGRHPLHFAGAYYIQEPSAMSPVEQLDIKPGDRVLDLCAAPGGKSTQIGALLQDEGLLVANEPVLKRAQILSENIERMGISNAMVLCQEPSKIADRFEGYFDKVLVDAPCSGEGMFRKNSLATTEWSLENVLMCQKRQRDILNSAVRTLSGGGRLVYSTCTFSEEENEQNVKWLLDSYPELRLLKMKRLWPHEIKGEGHFWALFAKEEASRSSINIQNKRVSRKELNSYLEFQRECLCLKSSSHLNREDAQYLIFGQELYLIFEDFPSVEGLKVLRPGLHLGTLKKDRFEPSFALSHYLEPKEAGHSLELSEEDALKVLKGQTLCFEGAKGYYLLTHKGFVLGWGKLSQGIMKNHYPKGLRIKC